MRRRPQPMPSCQIAWRHPPMPHWEKVIGFSRRTRRERSTLDPDSIWLSWRSLRETQELERSKASEPRFAIFFPLCSGLVGEPKAGAEWVPETSAGYSVSRPPMPAERQRSAGCRYGRPNTSINDAKHLRPVAPPCSQGYGDIDLFGAYIRFSAISNQCEIISLMLKPSPKIFGLRCRY